MAHFMVWISKMVNTIAEMVTSRVASPSRSRAVTLLEYVLLAAMVVAVRQALDYTSTWRAVGVCLVGWLILVLVTAVLMGMVAAMF